MRNMERDEGFQKGVLSLVKKHRIKEEKINDLLEEWARSGPPHSSTPIPGTGGSTYKEYVALTGTSKRKGARLIYYCDATRLVALYLYPKSVTEDIPTREIVNKLKMLELWEE